MKQFNIKKLKISRYYLNLYKKKIIILKNQLSAKYANKETEVKMFFLTSTKALIKFKNSIKWKIKIMVKSQKFY
jgi:hypothetical protein